MTEIVANEMIMLDPPSGGGARRSSARPTEQAAGNGGEYEFPETDYDDDLPF